MNNNFKPLINVSVAALAVFIVFLAVEISHISNTAATTNTVSFSGEGKVAAKPDIAVISASVLTQAVDSKSAQDDNADKSNAVTDILKKSGIADKDVQTSGYNISPQYKYPPYGGQPSIQGYQVSQSFTIKVRDLTKVSSVLSGLVSAGANQVNNLGLQIENPEALQAQARQMAIDAAKKKAHELQSQVGFSLGHIVNFSEGSNSPTPVYFQSKVMDGMGGGGGGPTPDISTGENTVYVNVTLTYQIK